MTTSWNGLVYKYKDTPTLLPGLKEAFGDEGSRQVFTLLEEHGWLRKGEYGIYESKKVSA